MSLPRLIIYVDADEVVRPDHKRRLRYNEFGSAYVAIEGDVPAEASAMPEWLAKAATGFAYVIPVAENGYHLGFHERDIPTGVTSDERTGHVIIVRGTNYNAVVRHGRDALNGVGHSLT